MKTYTLKISPITLKAINKILTKSAYELSTIALQQNDRTMQIIANELTSLVVASEAIAIIKIDCPI